MSLRHLPWINKDLMIYPVEACFVSAAICLLMVVHGGRKLGLTRGQFSRLLAGPRPTDPDELSVWQWTRRFLFAVLVSLAFALALVFIS